MHAYKANRRSAIEDLVDAGPVAARIRDIMAERTMWSGNASELLRVAAYPSSDDASRTGMGWPKSPERWPAGSAARKRPFERWALK